MNRNSGCGMLLVGVLILGAILWLIGVALWVLAVAAPLAGLAAGVHFFLQAATCRGAAERNAAADAEVEELVRDVSFDLSETLSRWEMLRLTKGIGTPLHGRDEETSTLHRQLIAAQEALQAATTPANRIDAVIHADTVRESAERFL